MSTTLVSPPKPKQVRTAGPPRGWWRAAVPVALAVAIALLPPPPGLAPHAWYYFALFTGVIAALVTEPLPNPAVGLIGLTLAAVLSRWTLYGPADLARPGFNVVSQSVNWALSGFASTTVWLVGGAFMFALGYEKTGLGRRIALLLVRVLGKRTLTLGYATTFADMILAPFTPSNTARGAGIIFPVVNNLPALYHSRPHDASARKIGGYIMWTTFAADCVTSTLFMTACAPNFLARDFIGRIAHVSISYGQWMRASLPFALPLLLALPLLTYFLFPPEIKRSPEASAWAGAELVKMGRVTWRESTLGVLVLCAILLWILGGSFIDPTLAAFVVLSAMLVLRRGHLGRHGPQPLGLDHDRAAGHAGDAGRRTVARRLREVVRRLHRDTCRRPAADADPDEPCRDLLRVALHVRQPDGAYHGDDADDAGGGPRHSGTVGNDAGDRPGDDHRHHGHPDAIRHRRGTAVL